MTAKKRTFEQGLEQLDALIKSMESGELSLEDSVDAFEKSMTLLSELQTQIDKTEKKVQKLSQRSGEGAPPAVKGEATEEDFQ